MGAIQLDYLGLQFSEHYTNFDCVYVIRGIEGIYIDKTSLRQNGDLGLFYHL